MRNKKSVIFMGTPDFAVPSLEKIHKEYHVLSVYTQPPKKSGRGLRTKLNPIHEISNDYNLPVKTPQNFKSFDIIEEIKNLKPDFIIVVAYGIILPKTVLIFPIFSVLMDMHLICQGGEGLLLFKEQLKQEIKQLQHV